MFKHLALSVTLPFKKEVDTHFRLDKAPSPFLDPKTQADYAFLKQFIDSSFGHKYRNKAVAGKLLALFRHEQGSLSSQMGADYSVALSSIQRFIAKPSAKYFRNMVSYLAQENSHIFLIMAHLTSKINSESFFTLTLLANFTMQCQGVFVYDNRQFKIPQPKSHDPRLEKITAKITVLDFRDPVFVQKYIALTSTMTRYSEDNGYTFLTPIIDAHAEELLASTLKVSQRELSWMTFELDTSEHVCSNKASAAKYKAFTWSLSQLTSIPLFLGESDLVTVMKKWVVLPSFAFLDAFFETLYSGKTVSGVPLREKRMPMNFLLSYLSPASFEDFLGVNGARPLNFYYTDFVSPDGRNMLLHPHGAYFGATSMLHDLFHYSMSCMMPETLYMFFNKDIKHFLEAAHFDLTGDSDGFRTPFSFMTLESDNCCLKAPLVGFYSKDVVMDASNAMEFNLARLLLHAIDLDFKNRGDRHELTRSIGTFFQLLSRNSQDYPWFNQSVFIDLFFGFYTRQAAFDLVLYDECFIYPPKQGINHTLWISQTLETRYSMMQIDPRVLENVEMLGN